MNCGKLQPVSEAGLARAERSTRVGSAGTAAIQSLRAYQPINATNAAGSLRIPKIRRNSALNAVTYLMIMINSKIATAKTM